MLCNRKLKPAGTIYCGKSVSFYYKKYDCDDKSALIPEFYPFYFY